VARYVEGVNRHQVTLLPECLEDYIAEDNTVRVVEAFVEELDLTALGFTRALPAETGRPAYHPAVLLKIFIYGYLNRIASSRRATGATLGTRRGRRTTTRQAGATTQADDRAATHRRTRVRDAEALDGINPLPDPRTCQREYRDEPAGAGLQP
jgi:hypothetical protein